MSELFNIPEQLSPRLAWLEKMKSMPGISVKERADDPRDPEAGNHFECVYFGFRTRGRDEEEAIEKMAVQLRVPHWLLEVK